MNKLVLHCSLAMRDRLILEDGGDGVYISTCVDGDEQYVRICANDIHLIIDFLEMCDANPCNRP